MALALGRQMKDRDTRELLNALVGQRIIVGMSWLDASGAQTAQSQFHGLIFAASLEDGVPVRTTDGTVHSMPPLPEAYQPAPPGQYREYSSGEWVTDPDLWVMWAVHDPSAEGDDPFWAYSHPDSPKRGLDSYRAWQASTADGPQPLLAASAFGRPCRIHHESKPSADRKMNDETRKQADALVIEALVQAGSDPAKHHELEHCFVCDTRTQTDAIRQWGRENGYKPTDVSDNEFDGRRYFRFDLMKQSPLDLEAISEDTRVLQALASEHGVEYDGWGCEVAS